MSKHITLLAAAGIVLAFGARALCDEAARPAPAAAKPASAAAAGAMPGKALVEAKCVSCHKDEVYNAKARKVSSLDGLRKQVAACSATVKSGWNDVQRADAVLYLNAEFYKLK